MPITVTYFDGIIAEFPLADTWTMLNMTRGNQMASSADVVLCKSPADGGDHLAIIGAGSYKSIVTHS